MKNLKLYIPLLALLSLFACKKSFLDTEDVTTATEQNFYKTPADAYKALVGVYDGLQRVWAGGIALPVAAEIMSDNLYGGGGASDGLGLQMVDEFDKLRSPSDQTLYGDNWGNYYKAIYRANMLLTHLDQVNWKGKEDLRNIYEAETRFIRAYCYFDMARLWGNVPLITKPTTDNVPQATPDSVYSLIAEDLKFAAANLPATSYTAQEASTHGRVTKWAAESLLGRVFLYYTGYYNKPDLLGAVSKAQALAYLEDVISNGGFGLISNFAELWPAASLKNYAGEDNKETVFAIKYTYTSDWNGNVDGNHWMVLLGIRVQSIYPYGLGWGAGTVNAKLWNAYPAGDTRKSASIISIADEGLDFQNRKDQREYTGYYVKKYTPMADSAGKSLAEKMGGTSFMISQYEDYVSIRYADVLLMAAELGSPNAQQYFDAVRQRALGSGFVQIPVNPANILNERRLEFAGEGIRYWDLLRQGVNVAASAIAESVTLESGGVNVTKTISASQITATKGLSQIPYSQITLSNGTLKQNEGW
ncbi:RagB/SusD family nutrient uptake outer membrane protein [Chitinophaga filiformis]|uniref:RagB/SusD family nutrient uptake outer membrane protein n=1 Tax=Chitinophaga filiformis TaxID=104663 RepID=A0ABY4HW86_CHIFI|nr:RagB/SusD family nutrient uptake outer membrane protein [Chitinophaga filiformis]UPK67434.1 RagB/SusD family nutrient uptake outer membrane protein [Chitinophaga filiformis]